MNPDPWTVDTTTDSSVDVEIFDQAYNLRGSDHDYIRNLAEYVDAKMRAIGEQNDALDSTCLAVLAALNIANEYHLLKTQVDDEESRERSPKLLTEEERQRTGSAANGTTPRGCMRNSF